ncbi:hypothetical protein LSUE1_G000167 [Lachnellula suecica]|uniref:NmrA-like domain-containing protein n=1 Tax=Lachnellula suecica TaxID=602035 RepID=A0A8T9CIN2_9HELO|nr:hypothetical protein LSUE1_G000167 [Lachnellula suecica]
MSTYLITQATGHQSQWTIEHLLIAGAKVHALVRDPKKVPTFLKRPGVTVFDRENDTPEAIFKAAEGCKGVFLNTFPSFGDADSYPLMSFYYETKHKIEEAVRATNFQSYTILRPTLIHHDYTVPRSAVNFPDLPKTGTLTHALNDGVGLLHIDEKDIGKYAAAALLDPIKFGGQEIELGNELLTIEEIRDILAKVSGKDIKVKKWTPEETKEALSSVFLSRFELWANIDPMTSSAKATAEKFGIPFTSLEEYLEREKAQLLASLPAEL